MSTKKIRFHRNCGNYNGGEVAGFDEATAAEYVKRNLAEYFTTEVASAPVVKAPAVKIEEPLPAEEATEEVKEKPKKKLLRRRSSRRRTTEE